MKRIDVISVPVTDQQRSKHFYMKLGFEVLAEQRMGNDQTWVQLGLQGSDTSITLVTWFKRMPAGTLQGLVIRTDNIDEDLHAFREQGIPLTGIEETPWGKFLSIKDPDGNGISFQQRNSTQSD